MTSIPDPSTHIFSEWILFGNFYYQARDIVGFGFELSVGNVTDAYKKGVFPWPIDGMPLPWFCPEKRAILELQDVHVSKSLKKEMNKGRYDFSIDRDFQSVVKGCSSVPRAHQAGTWITPEYTEVYSRLHEMGVVHSVEVWEGDELVGGLYGVDAGGVFCGESMFYRRANASKLALLHLIGYLEERGSEWIDIQVMTPHMKVFGAREILRDEFLEKLANTQQQDIKLF